MRVIFFGTPAYAASYLYSLIESDLKPVAVVCQPDRPTGRDKEILPPPVKELAQANGIPVLQPERANEPEWISKIKDLNPDLIVVVSFGQIISRELIDIPTRGCINVHPSLLPQLRGATPIQGAILHGLTETGVTIMLMDEKMDHGPVLAQQTITLSPTETYTSLAEKTIEVGRPLLISTIKGYLDGTIAPIEQDHAAATFTKLLKKETGKVSSQDSLAQVDRMMRALSPWPGVWCEYNGKRVKILETGKTIADTSHEAGTFFTDSALGPNAYYQLSDGAMEVVSIQPEGKSVMSSDAFARGYIRSNTNPASTI